MTVQSLIVSYAVPLAACAALFLGGAFIGSWTCFLFCLEWRCTVFSTESHAPLLAVGLGLSIIMMTAMFPALREHLDRIRSLFCAAVTAAGTSLPFGLHALCAALW